MSLFFLILNFQLIWSILGPNSEFSGVILKNCKAVSRTDEYEEKTWNSGFMTNIVAVTKHSPFRPSKRSCSQNHQIKILKLNKKYINPPHLHRNCQNSLAFCVQLKNKSKGTFCLDFMWGESFPRRSCRAPDKQTQLLLVLKHCIQNVVANTVKSKAFKANKNATHSQVIYSFFLSFG